MKFTLFLTGKHICIAFNLFSWHICTSQVLASNDNNNGNGTGDNSGIGNANTIQVDVASMMTQLMQAMQNNNT